MLLQPATVTTSPARIGLYGKQGSGKSLSSILLAVGLSREYHNNAPVALFDTEDASRFVAPICEAEGVPLVVAKSRSFVDMRDALREAQSCGCCVFVADSYSEPWRELNESLKARMGLENRRLQFHQREELWRLWGAWVTEFRSSPLHVILAGRLAHEYDEVDDEAGDPRLVKLGTKMRGEADAGYEPDLLIELEAIPDAKRDPKSKSKRGSMIHTMHVRKDRTLVLNGLHFSFKDLNQYQPGDYVKTFAAIKPHLTRLGLGVTAPGESAGRSERTSAELFTVATGESAFAERLKRITIAAEDFHATLQILWPGTTHAMKACHTAAIEAIYRSRSWAEVETKTAEAVEEGAQLLRACEAALPREAEGVAPGTRAEVLAWIMAVKTQRDEANVI